MTTYQFQIDEDEWTEWKNTVPRSKSLDERIRELIRADAEGRVQEPETDTTQPEPTPQEKAEADETTDARDVLESLDLPGSGPDYEIRVESVLTMYRELRSNPGVRMSKSDFRDVLEGRDVGYSGGFDSLWSNWVKSNPAQGHGENVLASLPGVELRGNDYVYSA
jgi:hypothetical protein